MIFWQVLGALVVFCLLPVIIPIALVLACVALGLACVGGVIWLLYTWPGPTLGTLAALLVTGYLANLWDRFMKWIDQKNGKVPEATTAE